MRGDRDCRRRDEGNAGGAEGIIRRLSSRKLSICDGIRMNCDLERMMKKGQSIM